MNLLIRSQDKSCLRKLRQAIWISYSELDNWCIECDYDTIGRYKTKARALEILDDIQNIICGNTHPAILKGVGAISDKAKNIFYQMPEE